MIQPGQSLLSADVFITFENLAGETRILGPFPFVRLGSEYITGPDDVTIADWAHNSWLLDDGTLWSNVMITATQRQYGDPGDDWIGFAEARMRERQEESGG